MGFLLFPFGDKSKDMLGGWIYVVNLILKEQMKRIDQKLEILKHIIKAFLQQGHTLTMNRLNYLGNSPVT